MSSRKLAFSDDDMKRYGRLDIAARDLHDAKAYGAFILKKGWKAKPWSRGSTYLQQSAFVTSMIVSYGRAFTKSLGGGFIPDSTRADFTIPEAELHEKIMAERHQLYAHSDAARFPVQPWHSDLHSDIIMFQVRELSPEEITMLHLMCDKVAIACRIEQSKIKANYV
jgi:hypothetical protein